MKNLENYGVEEMNTKEINETDGGFIWVELWGGFNWFSISPDYNKWNESLLV